MICDFFESMGVVICLFVYKLDGSIIFDFIKKLEEYGMIVFGEYSDIILVDSKCIYEVVV